MLLSSSSGAMALQVLMLRSTVMLISSPPGAMMLRSTEMLLSSPSGIRLHVSGFVVLDIII